MAIAGAPSTWAKTNPSEVEAQKLEERPTTAFKQTDPLGAGVIFTRTPSASKYLSCSATQMAANAKLGTAVNMVTSGNSFCCASVWGAAADRNIKTVKAPMPTRSLIRRFIAGSPFCYAWI
jgi:hypothetical protein